MRVVDFHIGCNIHRAAEQLAVEAAVSSDGKARGEFNGVMIIARRVSTPRALVSQWKSKSDARSKKYSRSSKAKARVIERVAHAVSMQQKHDDLMEQLPLIDFADYAVVLSWLCEFQDASDFNSVVGNPGAVLDLFAQHDYFPSEGGDVELDLENSVAVARWIIGESLSCLAGPIGAIHQVIHSFVEQWREKFITIH